MKGMHRIVAGTEAARKHQAKTGKVLIIADVPDDVRKHNEAVDAGGPIANCCRTLPESRW